MSNSSDSGRSSAARCSRSRHPRVYAGPLATIAAIALTVATALAAPASADPVVIDLDDPTGAEAAAIAGLLPTWEEAINAGATRLTVDRAAAERAVAAGLPVRVVGAGRAAVAAWPACITALDDLVTWLNDVAAARPDLVTVLDIGDSYCRTAGGCTTPGGDRLPGDDVLVARITAAASTAPKTGRLWIDGGLHARELATTELMRRTIGRLVAAYGVDANVTWLLDHREVYVGIAMNPDGRRLVELGASARYGGTPWYWRKNARPSALPTPCAWPPTTGRHDGVDLNRNHVFKWTAGGGSNDACAETYRGRSAGSEPEIAAYEAAVRAVLPDQRPPADADVAPDETTGVLINFHSFTNRGTVLTPWGWTTVPPPNADGLNAIGDRYAARVDYARQSALYPVSGNTRDWAYGELGIPAYVIELRGDDFFPRCTDLDAILDPHAAALDLTLALSDRPYARIRGPEVTALTASIVPAPGGDGRALRVDAHIDVAGTPARWAAGAEAVFGRAGGPWAGWPASLPPSTSPSGGGAALAAGDGAFDSRDEAASLVVDVADLPPGTYYAVVAARGNDGAWGPGRAVGFTVAEDETGGTATATATATATDIVTVTATASAAPTATPTLTGEPTAPATTTPTTTTPTTTAGPVPTATAPRLWLPIARRAR